MIDWQERITRDTGAAIRVEHRVRYALAAPLIVDAPLWADLGCGNGIAASEALGDRRPGRILLVDSSDEALGQASRELTVDALRTLHADLAAPADLERLREALAAEEVSGACLTAFEVVEHLADFGPLIELLVELAETKACTSVLSVPNDAFWAIENPYHLTKWGEGAFEELRRLLPDGHVVARQHALQGSVVDVDGASETRTVRVDPVPEPVATHFLVAFGPAAQRLGGAAEVAGADLLEQRRWERQRESDSAHLQATEQWLRAELEDWRGYIHELEGRLGLPLSGKQDSE